MSSMTHHPDPVLEPETPTIRLVIAGVDTHDSTHHAAVLDDLGRELGDQQFPATAAGYTAQLAWVRDHGQVVTIGVEGTGSYGAGLARQLCAAGVTVVEIDRPDRRIRRARGKSDPIDAYAAARAALSGAHVVVPKARDGIVEAIRMLRVTRRGAVKARTQTTNQLKTPALMKTCTRLRYPATGSLDDPASAIVVVLRRLARRYEYLTAEIRAADAELRPLITTAAPQMLTQLGVGLEVTGQLLTTVGDNPDRIRSEAAFAHLCGVAPIPASTGKTHRHRLNRGGDRAANNALYTVVLTRLRLDPRTRAYFTRRRAEGLSKREVTRCLQRYVARELYQLLVRLPASSSSWPIPRAEWVGQP
jgi:transposase